MADLSKIKIRASQTASWTDCPRRGAAKAYREMLKQAGFELPDYAYSVRFVASCLGTAVHTGAALALQNKIDGKETSLDDMTDSALKDFEVAKEDGLAFDTVTASPTEANTQIKAICKAYYHSILPNVQPISVEQSLSAILKDGTEITSHSDVLEIDSVRDLKTGKDPMSYHAQLGCYSLLAKANQICEPKQLIIDWLPRSKNFVEPKSFVFNVDICEQEAKSAIQQIVSQVSAFMASGDPCSFPASPMSNLCSERFCPAFGTGFCKLKEV